MAQRKNKIKSKDGSQSQWYEQVIKKENPTTKWSKERQKKNERVARKE